MKSRLSVRNAPLRITGPLLFVAPHFDDLSLSCDALIARPAAMTVLHVCTAVPVPAVSTEWDRQSGFTDSDEATAARRAEEMTALAGTPHAPPPAGLPHAAPAPLPPPSGGRRHVAGGVPAVDRAVLAHRASLSGRRDVTPW